MNFPDFSPGDTLKCEEDGSLKLKCDFDNGDQLLPDDTFPCCHLSVTVESDRKQCSYSDNETCTVLLTVDECNQGVNVYASPFTTTVDASSSGVLRMLNGKYSHTLMTNAYCMWCLYCATVAAGSFKDVPDTVCRWGGGAVK